MKKVIAISLLFFLPCLTSAQSRFWQQTNGPTGGSIRAFAVNRNGNVYAATSSSGIFRSIDDGMTWQQIGLPYWSFISLAVSPSGTLFAGHSAGLFRSTDEGFQWFEVRPIPYSGMAVAATPGGLVFASIGGIIYWSTDDGATWERRDAGVNSVIECLAVDSVGRVYAGGGFAGNGGVYRSTNNGDSWTLQSSGLNRRDIISIAVDSSGFVYAISPVSIVRSTNSGEQWEQLIFPVDTALFKSVVTRVNGELFVASWYFGVFHSTDFGITWIALSQGFRRQSGFLCLASNRSSGAVYASAEIDGVYLRRDGANQWGLSKFPGTSVLSLASDHVGRVFSTAVLTGVWRTTDRGEQWVQCSQGLVDTNIIALLRLPSGTLLAYGSAPGSLYRSTNSGDTWSLANNGIAGIYLRSSAVDSAGRTYLGTYSGIFVSMNDGETWSQVGTIPHSPRMIAATPAGILFADILPAAVARSTDHGATWARADSGLSGFSVQKLSAAHDGSLYAGGNSGVFSSTNDGLSWRRSMTAPNTTVTSFAQNSLGDLFASLSDGRVFRKRSSDTTWSSVSDDLPSLLINSITVSSDGFLFAGTDGAGVLRSVNQTTDVEVPAVALPARMLLFQNYPNPFNPATSIRYTLTSSSHVRLSVYDILGREIAVLINAIEPPGTRSIEFDAVGRPSGVYFCRLQLGSYVETRKMVLLQ